VFRKVPTARVLAKLISYYME